MGADLCCKRAVRESGAPYGSVFARLWNIQSKTCVHNFCGQFSAATCTVSPPDR